MLTFESVSTLGPTSDASYGNRATTFGPGLGPAGGPTPNIVLDFVPTGTVARPFTVYATGYHTLAHALGQGLLLHAGLQPLLCPAGHGQVVIGAPGPQQAVDARRLGAGAAVRYFQPCTSASSPSPSIQAWPLQPGAGPATVGAGWRAGAPAAVRATARAASAAGNCWPPSARRSATAAVRHSSVCGGGPGHNRRTVPARARVAGKLGACNGVVVCSIHMDSASRAARAWARHQSVRVTPRPGPSLRPLPVPRAPWPPR